MKKLVTLGIVLVLAVFSNSSNAALFEYSVVLDLGDTGIYIDLSQYNTAQIEVALEHSFDVPYSSGDTLIVNVSFLEGQRLVMTASPLGLSWPIGQEALGVYFYDSDLENIVSGNAASSVYLIDPMGEFYIDSSSNSTGYSAAQGAFTRIGGDYTDTSFSVAGLQFQMNLGAISQSIVPDTLTLEFREIQIQAVPVPPAIVLMLSAMFSSVAFSRRKRSHR